ncbi:hypothetical protein ACONUD_16730 [Microbulbifer harenosus]|uniref:Uncharacterized protein n=1 Tax=Microbulbifer harenosus TaxID=2576840 RepID=A0ABY2UDG5_9GAMM|nr:hypothetical protein [Microbulbifer harenosus]TLM74336.1 hypothetical protein FDY93_17915 [Microbulbifer harenosus]
MPIINRPVRFFSGILTAHLPAATTQDHPDCNFTDMCDGDFIIFAAVAGQQHHYLAAPWVSAPF